LFTPVDSKKGAIPLSQTPLGGSKQMKSINKFMPGFTLIELMVVVGILSLLMAIAVPATIHYRATANLRGAASEIFSELQSAKVNAIRRSSQVVVEFKDHSFTSAGQVGSYRVFQDTNQDWSDTKADGSAETILVDWTDMPGLVSLVRADFTDNGGEGGSSTKMVGFNNHGLAARAVNGTFVFGEVILRNSRNTYMRLVVTPAGMVQIQTKSEDSEWQ
jgi:prepilin-type N-terminal cleavage/methylation domain-containing protein